MLQCTRTRKAKKVIPQKIVLPVRRCDKHEWWVIERRVADVDEVLVFNFGSTPIFTRGYQSAMRLAMYCNGNNPPHGLRWIKETPDDCPGAIEFARKRRIDEALPQTMRNQMAICTELHDCGAANVTDRSR